MNAVKRRRVSWALAISLLALVSGAWAQNAEDGQADESAVEDIFFGEIINVRVVNVDVWVTDKKGNRILGLTKDDFEMFENKTQVKITNFYEYAEGKEVIVEEDVPEPEPEPVKPRRREDLFTSHPGFRSSDVPEDQRLSLMVYVDQLNITPFDRNRVFRYLRQFLRTKLDRDDRVMLVTYNRSLKVVRPFTSDPGMIADATYELEKHTGGRTLQRSERHDILRDINRDQVNYYQALGRVRMHAQNVENDLQFTLDGIREAVKQLAGIPGRKALLYISNGLPMRAGEDLFWAIDERFANDENVSDISSSAIMEVFQFDMSRRFDELASLANANRVTFYTLDAAGLRVGGMRSAEYQATNFSVNIDSLYNHNLQDSIIYLADRTGGQAIVNTNNFAGGFDKFAGDFENRYSLGFSPSHGGTGRRFKLRVELKKSVHKAYGKKLRVRYRDSYRDKPVVQEMGDATLAALTFGYQSNPLGVTFTLDEGPDAQIARDDGNYLVTFLIRIPIANVVLIPVGDHHEARVRVFVQAIDDKNKVSVVQEKPVELVIKTDDLETAKDEYWVYELKLLMEKGDQRVAVGVRDDLTARSSFLSRVVSVGS